MAVSRDAGYTVSGGGTDWPTSDYVPQLYAKKTLRKFYLETMFTMITNTDYEG